MTMLIIGGTGFLGTELVRQARAAGYSTVATYHATVPASSPTPSGTPLICETRSTWPWSWPRYARV